MSWNGNVIIGCEESQTVCKEFRKLGVNAFSNDLKQCSGGHNEWHIQGDFFKAIKLLDFNLAICHPPCTHIAVSGAKHFKQKIRDGRQQDAIKLFMKFVEVNIPHKCIENPVGIMSGLYKKPDQTIQPYYFGDNKQKTTHLWLTNLPPLFHAKEPDLFNQEITHVDKGEFVIMGGKKFPKWYAEVNADQNRGTIRSITFPGIAQAMAVQWTEYLQNKYK